MFSETVSTQCNMACDCNVVIHPDFAATMAADQLKSVRVATKRTIRVASLVRREVSSHRQLCCLVNILSRLTEKKETRKLNILVIYEGNHRWPVDKGQQWGKRIHVLTSHDLLRHRLMWERSVHAILFSIRRVWKTWNNYLAVEKISGHNLQQ